MTAATLDHGTHTGEQTHDGGLQCGSRHLGSNNVCTVTAVAIAQSCQRPEPFLVCQAWCAYVARERLTRMYCCYCLQYVRDCWTVVML